MTARATAQIEEIVAYVARDSNDAADKVKAEFFKAFALLATHPALGRARDDFPRQSLKFWSVYSYLVAYDPATSPLEIVAVFRGSRQPGEWLG